MTTEKIREAIAIYRKFFEGRRIEKGEFPHESFSLSPVDQFQHCHGMLDQMEQFLTDGQREKAMRWVCFIRGVLWGQGIYNLEALKAHNRSV